MLLSEPSNYLDIAFSIRAFVLQRDVEKKSKYFLTFTSSFFNTLTTIHTLWTTPSPTFIPSECLTQMPLLQLVTDDAKYWEQCGKSVSVFEDWDFIGASDTYYDTK